MQPALLLAGLGWFCLTGLGLAVYFGFDPGETMMPVLLVISNAVTSLYVLLVLHISQKKYVEPVERPAEACLHWDPQIQRRGMGDLIKSINHMAIIVSDVGRSLAFYTEIIGFQQIQRPNFDRHGAWLTMGNLELHLIKGVPNAPTGRDLIVSHIALETEHPEKVLEKLLEFEVPFRQNISVPDPKKARDNLVEAFENSEGKITQYFVRDPDGYYLELCNCDVLTAFCLFKEKDSMKQKGGHIPKYQQLMDAVLGTYNESGQVKPSAFRLPQLFKTGVFVHHWVRRARVELKKSFAERCEAALAQVQEAAIPNPDILAKFMGRRKTYCDVCQGFSEEDLCAALCKSGNHAPTALLLLAACRENVRIFFPPQYLLSEGGRIPQQVMAVPAPNYKRFGSFGMFRSKPFEDVELNTRKSSSSTTSRDSFWRRNLFDRETPAKQEKVTTSNTLKMLALTFQDDPKMHDYLSKNHRLRRKQVQVEDMPDIEEGVEEVTFL